jgi:SAM-dependent methyltransferase
MNQHCSPQGPDPAAPGRSDALMDLLGRFVADLGAAAAAGNIVVGHRLGLYPALAAEPATPTELAARTGMDARYVSEWLAGQAAGRYVQLDSDSGRYSMTPEQSYAMADPKGPNLPAAFQVAVGAMRAAPRISEAFRTGGGMGWHEHDHDVFSGTEAFFRPAYAANLIPDWLPALDGVVDKLAAGGRIADVGCGHGSSTVLLAQEFPHATIVGSDYHRESIEVARKRAAEAGVAEQTTFEVASAQTFTGTGYDLVATFDALHDMGDPLGSARHVLQSLAADGTWLIVEPFAGDSVADNVNPVGRMYYSFSTFLCVPNGKSQPGGYALGAQAGPAAIRQLVLDAGFSRFRQAAQTPFNLVFEARP